MRRRSLLFPFLTLALVPLTTGCALFLGYEKSSESDAQTAFGLRGSPLILPLERGGIHLVTGYQRQTFDGGHDNVFTGGVQLRRPVGGSGVWLGGEATYNNWRFVPDDEPFSIDEEAVANVWGLGALVGKPVGDGGLNVWGAVQYLRFGDFESDDQAVFEGGNGWQVSAGLEMTNLLDRLRGN